MSTSLRWLLDMVEFFSKDTITIPAGYREKVLETKKLLQNDVSGLTNTMLDFAIASAVDVEYKIETNNSNLNEIMNNWLGDINSSLRGKIPTGIDALAKEYFRERWKGSSFLLLRTFWEDVGEYNLPTILYFTDGEDITMSPEDLRKTNVSLEEKNYRLRLGPNKSKLLPNKKNEIDFIQKPFSPWGSDFTVPYIIQKGLYKNMKMLEMLEEKGEAVVGKSLEYLMMVKKGSERLAEMSIVYDEKDLSKAKEDLQKIIADRKNKKGVPTYTTNFDTDIEHLIPEYVKVLQGSLFAPIEKRILAGIGLVDIVEGTSSSRRESILNPKPFVGETRDGVNDFKSMIKDVLVTIVQRNKHRHKKYFGDGKINEIRSSPIKMFLSEDAKIMLRSVYDRGSLSKRTFAEICGEVDFDMEVERRKREKEDKLNKEMYPPVIQNLEQHPDPGQKPVEPLPKDPTKKTEEVPDDKKTAPEKRNFKQASVEGLDLEYEEAPYNKNADLPKQVKVLPSRAQTIWRTVFNENIDKGEDSARKIAWSVVKKVYHKKDEKWVRKSKGMIEESFKELNIGELIELKKMEILGKQSKLLERLLENSEQEDPNENTE